MIRSARNSDLKSIARLIEELGYPTDDQELTERLQALKNTKQELYVFEDDGVVAGLICYACMPQLHCSGTIGRITQLVVLTSYKGSGIGRKLVEFIEERARSSGHERIELTTGLQRIDAHEFYKKLGYTETSKRFSKNL